ncbi:MAG: FAD-binding protein [Planctomycetes bacterium]|nr:FAD-binding protein [Planctomycetota bacterium]
MDTDHLADRLRRVVGRENVLDRDVDLQVYEYDAGVDMAYPRLVCFPTSTRQVSDVVKLLHKQQIPFVARGAGTNLSGGTVCKDAVIIEMSRMNRILEIDYPNMRAVVEPGLVNLHLVNTVAKDGYLYAPDPASQKVSTLGGNIGENSGGPHCLKYGVTTNHVLGLEVVLPNGQVIEVGGKALDTPGYDLTGLIVGSEGTFGIVTKITVRLIRQPEAIKTMLAIFNSLQDAADSVSAIIAAGILPATLELLDKAFIHAIEESLKCGYPLDAEAVLLIELDGIRDGLDRLAGHVTDLCKEHNVREVRVAKSDEEREHLWAGRRGAFGSLARMAPNFLTLDGTVPRTKLPEVLAKVVEIAKRHGLKVANCLHAGDGNLHPCLLYDERDDGAKKATRIAGFEILQACADAGGTLSGEHGIGIEKQNAMPFVFTKSDLDAMRRVKDVFDPAGLCNAEKIFPTEEASAHGE